MFGALHSTLRSHRRRVLIIVAVLALAGAVLTAHSALADDHMGSEVAVCLAIAQSAVVGVGTAIALGGLRRRLLWPPGRLCFSDPPPIPAAVGFRARAGPPRLQVFRL